MDVVEALVIGGVLGAGLLFFKNMQTAAATTAAAAAAGASVPCGVPVSAGGVTTVIPCKTLTGALPAVAKGITSLFGSRGSPPMPNDGHTFLNTPSDTGGGYPNGTLDALRLIADAACNCYGGYGASYGVRNGPTMDACSFVRKYAPEWSPCAEGDCDCHPTINPPNNITYYTHAIRVSGGAPKTVQIAQALPGGALNQGAS